MARRVSRIVLVRSFNRSLGEVELRLRDREPERLGANNEEVPRWTWLITPSKTSPQGSLRFNDGDGSILLKNSFPTGDEKILAVIGSDAGFRLAGDT